MKWCKNIMIDIGFENIKITFIKNDFNGIYLIRNGSKYNIEVLRTHIYNEPFGMIRKYDKLHMKDVQRL
jgi:hypothetical protein